jgi:haloalkane dehalogenase
VVATNTGLPTGDHQMPDIWHQFRTAVQTADRLDVGRFVASGCRRLSDEARAAYDAPFPDESFKAGPRAMPGLVPITPDDPASEANRRAWDRLAEWDRPFLVAFSDGDPITGGMAPILRKMVPGAAEQPEVTIPGAGHFVQEDAGVELAQAVVEFVRRTPQ